MSTPFSVFQTLSKSALLKELLYIEATRFPDLSALNVTFPFPVAP